MTTTEWFRDVIGRRPAETATAFTGAIGLLLAQIIGGGDNIETGLVVLLAALPGAVSFLYSRGAGEATPRNAELSRELDGLALRAARRARLGMPTWSSDIDRATRLRHLQTLLHPAPGTPADTSGEAPPKAKTATGGDPA